MQSNPATRVALDDTPPFIGMEFRQEGRTWRVTSLVDTFVIGTAVDAVLNSHGEPSRESDIIKVML